MILAINSSTVQYSAALMTLEGVIIADFMVSPKGNTFTEFIPGIDRLLKSSGTGIETLSAVAVTAGPGSFTGLRVGLAAAKGVAYSMNVPLIGISGIDALASSIPYADIPVCAMIASRRDEAFYAFFRNEEGNIPARQTPDRSMKIKEIGSLIDTPTIIVGNDFKKQKPLIEEAGNEYLIYARPDYWSLRASSVGILGLKRFHNNDFDDVMDIVPNYIQPPDIRPGK